MASRVMDNNHNQDGLNGMPLEPWMSQQHLSSVHPSLSSQIYNPPMSAQSIHDFMSHRTLQSFPAVEPMHSSQTASSTALQQYSLSSTARHHQPEHVSISHERSAWSHLLSLDPSVATMGSHISEPQEPLRHYRPQDTPHFVQNTRQEHLLMLKGNTKSTSFDNRSLPKMQFTLASSSTASIPHDNYSQLPGVNSSQNKISQFSQLMNMSKKTRNVIKPSTPKTLGISNDAPSLESSGSYSPVSPPTTDIDEPSVSISGQNTGRVAELFMRDTHEISSAAFPMISSPEQADIFNYLSEKTDPFSSDLNMQDSLSESVQPHNLSHLLSNPSDVPLDMTTAITSKAGKGNDLKESSPVGAEVIFSPESTTSDKSSLIQTLLTKDQSYHRDFLNEVNTTSLSDRSQPQFSVLATSDEKMIKPVKSTPKKSNFYGRDASLFSFVPPSSFSGETQASTLSFSESSGSDVKENESFFNNANEIYSETVNVQEHEKLDSAAEKNTIIINEAKINTDVDNNSSSITEPVVTFPSETVANILTSSANTPVLECITSQSLNDDTLTESLNDDTLTEPLDAKETFLKQNDNSLEFENCDPTNSNFKCVLNSNGNLMISGAVNNEKVQGDENVNHWNENIDTPDQIGDFLPTNVTSKAKPSKRRKRKASGFQTKQRKKPVRKQLKISQSEVCDDSIMNVESNDYSSNIDAVNTEVSILQDHENVPSSHETVPLKRKTRQLSKVKASSSDLTPRRSSSRKSKDNAMRLIELQADSNYSGVSQPVEFEEKKSVRKRKKSRSSISLAASDDSEEFSNDSTEDDKSDEHDGDYVVDEDELEDPDNDEILKTGKKFNKEKKLGGLKISIKLSGNSSAEIVSGISDSFTKKKRKTMKKKNVKVKGKDKVKIHEQLDETDVQEIKSLSSIVENVQETANSVVGDKVEETGNSSDVKDRHESLMEKYFSSANSATAARQIHKKTASGKETKANKKSTDSAKPKLGKSLTVKSIRKQSDQVDGGKQKASVKFILDSTVKKDRAEKGMSQEDAEIEIPKFVCGYCPQRYHNKQELLAHMEAHMVEMERRNDSEVTPVVDEISKDQLTTVNLTASRVPKSNRTSTATTSESTTEKEKLKSFGDQDKDTDLKHVQASVNQKFKCGECGQCFDSKPGLLDHVRIHTAEKPFECDICHKCFTERNLLSAHRKTHGQEKLLRCLVCSKAFVDKVDLNIHMQSHPRRSNIKSIGLLPVKKSIKKGVHEKHDEEDSVPSKKPKSFALALTGEVDLSGKTNDVSPVLILTRRDKPFTDVKSSNSAGSKTILSEPVVSLKAVTPPFNKSTVPMKTNNNVKKPAESPFVNSNVKSDNNRIDSKNNNGVETNSQVKAPEVASSLCTCKECPDCVTRFLQSFE